MGDVLALLWECLFAYCASNPPVLPVFLAVFTQHVEFDAHVVVVQQGEGAPRTLEHPSPMRVGTSMLTLCTPGMKLPTSSLDAADSIGKFNSCALAFPTQS